MSDTFGKIMKLVRKAEKETCQVVKVPIDLLKEAGHEVENIEIELCEANHDLAERRWIPVSEGLPDEYTNVLVMSKRFEEPKIDQIWIVGGEKLWTLDNVTHWMPLPPKEGEQG